MRAGRYSRRVDSGAVVRAPFAAMQWRLLLLWVFLLWLPTAIVSLPFWLALSSTIDHSIHVGEWASRFSATMFGDALSTMGGSTWFRGTALLGTVLTLFMMPFLNGMAIGAGRAGRRLGVTHLLQCGVVEYGRMFRMMLWSILPYAVSVALIGALMGMVGNIKDDAVLQSQADSAAHMVWIVVVVLFVLAHAIVESGRAAFIADPNLRSATRAFGRGFMQLLRRPISTLLSYAVISLIGYAAALALGVARVNTPAIGAAGLVLAILLTQLVVLAIGWAHVARLFVLAEVGRSLVPQRSGGGLPPAI